jgi:uncharacterized protein (UPF0147 family)|tara:strand:- start:261 stop:443 length:183 start_codon:yes stop_codon:yes gene_type:complete
MACKQSDLIAAVNAYSSARVSNDPNLIQYGANLLQQVIGTLEFAPEEEEVETSETEVVAE